MSNKYIIALLFFSICAGLLACSDQGQKAGNAAAMIKNYPVLVIKADSTTLISAYPATIEGQQNVEIRPMIDGYIDKIYVDEGATVRSGQQLFRIRAPQYEQEVRTAQANISIAQANVNAARMEVNKVRPLVEKNIISKYELQSAEYSLQSMESSLAQARASLANAKTNLGYTIVSSPVNGVIGNLPLKIGSLVSRSTVQPLTTVSNISNIYAYFSINEKQVLAFSVNTKGKNTKERLHSIPPVTLVLANGVELQDKGKIETASGLINTETGSLQVRATFPNTKGLVRSGSSGMVQIPTHLDSAIQIPQKSTYEIQGKKFVYLVGDSSKVKSVEIKIRETGDGKFYLVEAGLVPGDRIVLEGVAGLREGEIIKPDPVHADSIFANHN